VEPEFTWHAAKRIVERGLDGAAILAKARDAMAAGIGATKPGQVEYGRLRLIIHEHRIITVFTRSTGGGPRRNERGRGKRQRKRRGTE
jgi:hypothetical protein